MKIIVSSQTLHISIQCCLTNGKLITVHGKYECSWLMVCQNKFMMFFNKLLLTISRLNATILLHFTPLRKKSCRFFLIFHNIFSLIVYHFRFVSMKFYVIKMFGRHQINFRNIIYNPNTIKKILSKTTHFILIV